MKLRILWSLLPVCIAASVCVARSSVPEMRKFSPPFRRFRFTYSFTVTRGLVSYPCR